MRKTRINDLPSIIFPTTTPLAFLMFLNADLSLCVVGMGTLDAMLTPALDSNRLSGRLKMSMPRQSRGEIAKPYQYV